MTAEVIFEDSALFPIRHAEAVGGFAIEWQHGELEFLRSRHLEVIAIGLVIYHNFNPSLLSHLAWYFMVFPEVLDQSGIQGWQ